MKRPDQIKILIACEYSGITREAFNKLGFDVTSCDLLPTEIPGKHIQTDVFNIIPGYFDLMIAHPPCTYLSFAGNKYLNNPGRLLKRIQALEFFAKLWETSIKHIFIENPIGWANKAIKEADQIINPYYFNDPHLKRTCLWLKNLPPLSYSLQPTLFDIQTSLAKPKPIYKTKSGKNLYFTEAKTTGHTRSKTFPGIANAMASQWSEFLLNESNNNLPF